MPDVTAYVEDRQTSEFYPTPEKLVHRMLGKVKWDLIQTVLEPSAGKGDIVRGIATAPMRDYHKDRIDVDCIELDPNLREILKYSYTTNGFQTIIQNERCGCSISEWQRKGVNEMSEVRLIDANALKYYLCTNCDWHDTCSATCWAVRTIRLQETIEAEPVRHGRWIFGSSKTSCWMTCSICCKSQSGQTATFSYCPNCGARMDGGADNAP